VLRRVLLAALLGGLGIAALAAIAIFYAWNTIELPPDAKLAQTTFITDANGKQLAMLNAGENRVPVALADVPPVVRQAIIDTEDHKFYSHGGVDPLGVVRALVSDARGKGNLQGGSTLTQQYVKNAYVGSQVTLTRKFKEAILATKLEQRYSKDEILERYVNTIYWGRGAYGIQTASRAYFDKDVKQLGLQEASYLAGLIRGPELADAYSAPEVAASRRSATLAAMVRYGHVPQAQADAVNKVALASYVVKARTTGAKVATADKGTQYFVDYVKQVLIQRYGEQVVETGGLRVKTTLDLDQQAKAYDSVYGFLKPNEPAGALVSLDDNGYIRAMVGGRDWSASKVNLAIGAAGGGGGRQAGSTFKPIALAAALEDGVCYKEAFSGPAHLRLEASDGTPWNVSNFSNEQFGRIDLVEATAESVNTVYAQLALQVGASRIVSEAQQLGIQSRLAPVDSLVLGSGEVSVLDMADAYLTFSQGGVRVAPTPILEVKRSDGELMEKAKPERTRVMDEAVANQVNYVLQQVVQHGTGTAAQIGKPLAGKTGTTEDNGDAWFVGYTPNRSTAVWMGYPEGRSHQMSNVRGIAVTGGTFPAQIFSRYMRQATAKDPATAFKAPGSCTPDHGVVETTTTTTEPEGTTSTTEPDALTSIPDQRQDDGKADRGERRSTTTVEPTTTTIVTHDSKDHGGPLVTIAPPFR